MVDHDRVLARLDELDGYLRELRAVAPARFEDYQRTEIRRSCERPAVQERYDRIALETCMLFLTADLGDLR